MRTLTENRAVRIVPATASSSPGGASMKTAKHQEEPPAPSPSRDDRRRGAMLGLAIGDALGAAVEFQPPGSFPEVTGYRDGGPHGLGPGEGTDDTSMALALADSIGLVGWDLNDQAERYLQWYRSGVYSVNGRLFDIGITTRGSLERFGRTGDARAAGDASPRASGNGSIMRLAPVPVAYHDLFPDQLDLLAERLIES